jgi:hypothetical protein
MVKIQKKSGVEREVQREGERGSRSRGKREWHWVLYSLMHNFT